MRYVPHLIPERSKVLHEYFTGSEYVREHSTSKKILCFAGALLLFLIALVYGKHPPLFLLICLMAIGLLLPVHYWLEAKLYFKLTTRIKVILYGILLVPCIFLKSHYEEVDREVAKQRTIYEEKVRKENLLLAVRDSIRRDSLQRDLTILTNLSVVTGMSQSQIDVCYNHALTLAKTREEVIQLERAKLGIKKIYLSRLLKNGKYKAALPDLDKLIAQWPGETSLLYSRAICKDKLGDPEAAVKDLLKAMESGDEAAQKYHEKINPERKRVIGYVTRCCDGSTSSARGRGACSWHGGVCNWNDPIYETYRKY